MPGGDGTGPQGRGPMTGRAMGRCAGYDIPQRPRFGYGRGAGRGFGFNRAANVPAPAQNANEKEYLEATVTRLSSELEAIRKRLEEL